MSKHKLSNVEINRLWDLHKLGVSNVKIADELCVSERAIRYQLGKGEPENGHGVFRSLSDNEEKRKDSIVDILDKQIVILSNKLEDADDIKISRASEFLKATQALTDAIEMRTKISSNANVNASSALEQLDLTQMNAFKEMPEDARRNLIRELKCGI